MESHLVLQIPSVNSEEELHVDPSAVAVAGSVVVHAVLTAALLGTGIGWVIGFAAASVE